jgi:hypothetical protein
MGWQVLIGFSEQNECSSNLSYEEARRAESPGMARFRRAVARYASRCLSCHRKSQVQTVIFALSPQRCDSPSTKLDFKEGAAKPTPSQVRIDFVAHHHDLETGVSHLTYRGR